MKLNSFSGIAAYAKDLDATWQFYETLGFKMGDRDERHAKVYINWFSIDFLAQDAEDKLAFQKDAHAEHKGAGIYWYIKVDDVDATHKEIVERGLQPSSEPQNWPWGNREFVLKDPDGYKLVFFNNAKKQLEP